MINKKQSRLRRARATRARILLQKVDRLTVHRTNLHIYASIISADNGRTLVSASTVEPEVRAQLANVTGRGGNIAAAKIVGARIAEKAKAPVSNPAPSTVPATVSMAVSPRSPKLRAKPASSSKRSLWLRFKLKTRSKNSTTVCVKR